MDKGLGDLAQIGVSQSRNFIQLRSTDTLKGNRGICN